MSSTLEQLFGYVNRMHDPQALEEMVFELYAPEATFADPVQKAQGRKEILKMYQDMLRVFPEIGITLLREIENDDLAVAEWEMTFKSKYWPVRIPLKGTTWLSLDNQGRVTEHQDYWDLLEFLKGSLPLQAVLDERLPEPAKKLLARLGLANR